MKTFLTLCLLLLGGQASATHLLGGYVQARSAAGSALTYEVTVTIYYNESAAASNENSITLCLGDGTTQEVVRLSRIVSNDRLLSINTYRLVHTYAGPGTYTLTTSLANRTASLNISNVDAQEPLTLSTTFTTSTTTPNRTPVLSIPQTGFQVGVNQRLIFPLKATDEDGDSLVYSLTRPLTNSAGNSCGQRTVGSYQYPNDLTRRGTFKLDSRTGDLTWDAPTQLGYYSVAITVGEYRNDLLISLTNQEILLIVVDRPATPGIIPPYEPAREGGLVTALTDYPDEDVTLTVFPNPVDDRLQVVIQTGNPAMARTQLLDGNGRILHELTVGRLVRRHEQVISMGSLTPGLYVLRADIGGRTLVRKVVKK